MVTGATGMLGKALVEAAKAARHEVRSVGHVVPIHDLPAVRRAFERLGPDVVINAAGRIPQARASGDYNTEMVLANALGPQVLAAQCRTLQVPLIHVSTDCVFSGRPPTAIHSVSDLPDAADVYGRSKLVGEAIINSDHPANLITVVRTSFIGFDHGLLRWLLDMEDGAEITGYTRAWWSGSTVDAVARGLIEIAEERPGGIQHLATAPAMSKATVLSMLVRGLDLSRRLVFSDEPFIGRGLLPTHELQPLEEAITELVQRRP